MISTQRYCRPPDWTTPLHTPLPFHLRLLQWDCASECDYSCQRSVTASLLQRRSPKLHQFHGKWPFNRVCGVQEPASVVFSLGNGYAHYVGLQRLTDRRAPTASPSHPLRQTLILGSCIAINAWIWSAVFHTRDFRFTERADYFSAASYIYYSLYYAFRRVVLLSQRQQGGQRWTSTWAACGIGCAFCLHVGYLSFVRFDYGYNMLAGVSVGLLQNLIWVAFSIQKYFWEAWPRWSLWPAAIVTCLSLAMCFELFDFYPWMDTIDAHSLWHLATIPITFWWYEFIMRDIAAIAKSKR